MCFSTKRELDRVGSFVRHVDCNVYARSPKAGESAMAPLKCRYGTL